MSEIKLTQYSHGAGCGCKISPAILSELIPQLDDSLVNRNLLVGNDSSDDAAVYDLGNGTAIISTTDFFMPIVDDPFLYGSIAATNAISDVYAMGGTPLVAIAILGWPIHKLPAKIANQVMEGGKKACAAAGIQIAGGHSIDSPEPIFGLAVTGRVELERLKRNNTATENCQLYLTKPLGVGILSTAQKKGILKKEDAHLASDSMNQLNNVGRELSILEGVKAMTDVTGFGLLGHLRELCNGSQLSSIINFNQVPFLKNIRHYLQLEAIPGGTNRNWESYGHQIELENKEQRILLCDPQTSGGLLIAVEPDFSQKVEYILKENNCLVAKIGQMIPKEDFAVKVK